MTPEQKEDRRQLWKKRVSAFKESGQSARSWCKANELKEHQLRYWLEKYDPVEKTTSVSKWISVEVEEKPINQDSTITIKVEQATIEVKPGFDPALLRDVVRALHGPC